LRRLAKQRREDDYASRRDYQTIQETRSRRIAAVQAHLQLIQLTKSLRSNKTGIGGFGGYIRTDVPAEISVNVTVNGSKLLVESFTLGNAWSRDRKRDPCIGAAVGGC
jgi:hypothetical protein